MRIHKSDPVALSGYAFKSWQEIMSAVAERARERKALLTEADNYRSDEKIRLELGHNL